MKKGKLKFFNRFKGYGVISDHETGKEYNVSPAGMRDIVIQDGDNVIFEVSEGRNGIMNAIDVRPDVFVVNS